MKGKSRFIKRVKISSLKFRLLLRCFLSDITALSAAEIIGVNRKTADLYYRHYRRLILFNQDRDRRRFLSARETEIDESYFGPTRVKGKRGRGAGNKIAVIGLLQRAGQVFTSPVDSCTKDQLLPVILAKVKQGADIYIDGWTSYDALAIYGFNHKKVKHDDNEFSAGDGNHINGIESFWSFAKRRLAKFNGIRKAFFSDYLLETEWRFNHRDTMEPVLKQLVRNDRRTPL